MSRGWARVPSHIEIATFMPGPGQLLQRRSGDRRAQGLLQHRALVGRARVVGGLDHRRAVVGQLDFEPSDAVCEPHLHGDERRLHHSTITRTVRDAISQTPAAVRATMTGHGARRRPDRRSRAVGHRRRAPPAGPPAGKTLRDLRGARRDRRDVGPVPLSRRAVGLGHADARLPVPAVEQRQGDRRRAVDPRPTCATPRARPGSTSGCASAIACSGPSWAGRALDDLRRGLRADHAATSSTRAAATTATTRATGRRSRASTRSQGQMIHPQFWPADLDYAGKRVVVIGSGATAVTLVPALTDKAAHVTMLQRSPTLHPLDPLDGRDRQPAAAGAGRRAARTPSRAGRTSRWRPRSTSSASAGRGS